MASLTRLKARGAGGKPSWRIQFYDGAGDRRAVHLGTLPKKAAETWQSRVEQLNACAVAGVAIATDLAAWVASLPDVSHGKLSRVGLVEPRAAADKEIITLGRLTNTFSDRSTGKPSTIKSYKQTLDSLVEFFGADVPVDAITADGADRWRVWIMTEKKGSGRRKKKRIATDNRLAKATIAKRVTLAKQLFRAALRWGMLVRSPFGGLRPGSQANPARAHYVSLRVIRDVLHSCPSIEWKLLVALARLGGLRCPSEVGALTWDHINWEKGRLMVLAPKTEHHGGEHAVRVVPICPELRSVLAEGFDRAAPGATFVVPMSARPGVNFGTHLRRIILKAGHKPWARLLQNLRASCETDWVERYPAHAVAKWLGHSPKVAAEHYLMSREHHFEDVVRGTTTGVVDDAETLATTPVESAAECSAKCDAIETRNATPQAPASGSAESQKMTEPAATTGVTAGSSGMAPITEIGKVGDIGLEPMTPSLSS